jgi:hypothetical protein
MKGIHLKRDAHLYIYKFSFYHTENIPNLHYENIAVNTT